MVVVIIDYGSGNLRSAAKALERASRESGAEVEICVSNDPDAIAHADHIVLPGVGAFADCMSGLKSIDGLAEALREVVLTRGQPFLGICVGMQLLAREGIEHGHHNGLGWIDGQVVHLNPTDTTLKIPHMGWNEIDIRASNHAVLAGLDNAQSHVYFVHSYHMKPTDPAHVLATTDYAGPVTAIVGRDNIIGTQFHPEKSQAVGLALIANFLNWRP